MSKNLGKTWKDREFKRGMIVSPWFFQSFPHGIPVSPWFFHRFVPPSPHQFPASPGVAVREGCREGRQVFYLQVSITGIINSTGIMVMINSNDDSND